MTENKMLLMDGVKYYLCTPKKEEELENNIIAHAEDVFGRDCIYFNVKKKITSETGISTIPDAFLVNFEKKYFYIVEIELSTHHEYDHINKQIGRFISALKNYRTRQKIANILKDSVEDDIVKQKFVEDNIGKKELYKFFLEEILDKVKDQEYYTIIVIDELTEKISEACSLLIKNPKILEFKTFARENISDLRVHCHLFNPLSKLESNYKYYKHKEEKIEYKRKGFTGKKIISFSFQNNSYPVKNWRGLLESISQVIQNKHTSEFDKVLSLKGRKRYYFSRNANDLRLPLKIKGTDIYYESNLSANSIVKLCNELLNIFGYDTDSVKINMQNNS